MREVRYITTGNYRKKAHNDLAKEMKQGNSLAIAIAAAEMERYIPDNAVLIPMPSHKGFATYTLELAKRIGELTQTEVCDTLKGSPRKSLYQLKKEGRNPRKAKFGFYLTASIPSGKQIIIIDNVVATGTTAAAAATAVGDCVVFALADDGRAKKIKGMKKMETIN